MSPVALDQIKRHPFTGNVRELQNCIERAIILCEGKWLLPQDLGLTLIPQSTMETSLKNLNQDNTSEWTKGSPEGFNQRENAHAPCPMFSWGSLLGSVEGEAPWALPVEGATQAPVIVGLQAVSHAAVRLVESRLIKAVLAKMGGNKWKAAKELKVSYKTLLNKIKEYNIET